MHGRFFRFCRCCQASTGAGGVMAIIEWEGVTKSVNR
jgi:hypothetical protein